MQHSDLPQCIQQVCWLPLECISPRPSVTFGGEDSASLGELAESIRQRGLLEPVTVRAAAGGRYEIVSGNRRLMAARMAGLTHLDAVVLCGDLPQADAQALTDMLLTGGRHYLEQAAALKELVERCGVTREEAARLMGCTAASVTRRLTLCRLDAELQGYLMEQRLSEGVALALARLPDPQARRRIARQAAAERLCVRDVELLVTSAIARLPAPPAPGGRTIALMRDHRLYLNAIRAIVSQMQEAGIPAVTSERPVAGGVEFTLRMPVRRRRARGQVAGP